MPTALQTALASMTMHGRNDLRTMADFTSGRMARLSEQRDERWEKLRRLEEDSGDLRVSYEEASADGLVEDAAEGLSNFLGIGGVFGIGHKEQKLQLKMQRTQLEIDTEKAKVDVIREELSSASSDLSRRANALEMEEGSTREILDEQARSDRGVRSEEGAQVQLDPGAQSVAAAQSASLTLVAELDRAAFDAQSAAVRRQADQIDEVHARKSASLDSVEHQDFFLSVCRIVGSVGAGLGPFSNTFNAAMLATKSFAGISAGSRIFAATISAIPSGLVGALSGAPVGSGAGTIAGSPFDHSAEIEAEAARAELREKTTRDRLEHLSTVRGDLSEARLEAHRSMGRIREFRRKTNG